MSCLPVTRPPRNIKNKAVTAIAVTPAARITGRLKSHGVPKRPQAVGTVACIIMAPLMLASAMRSFPCRTQMIAFMVSGISVAIGLKSRATS